MAKRSAVEQIVIEEKNVSEAIAKLIASREKASAWHLKWAKFEECEFLIFLFGKLAELRWIWNEAYRSFFEKHQNDYLKTFKDIYHEERVIEDAKKALQSCEASMTKIKKQIETAQRKGDSVKLHSLDQELNSQLGMKHHLMKKIEGHGEKMDKYKIEQVQKGLLSQAQSGLQLAEQMRHLFIAQLRIADILGTCTADNSATWQLITQTLIGLADTLSLHPPPSGAVDPLPSPSESPVQGRSKSTDSPIPISSPVLSSCSSGSQTPTGRRSFPFPFRPLPNEPSEVDPSAHHHHSHTPPQTASPNHTPTHASGYQQQQGNGYRGRSFTRSASDMTPTRTAKPLPSTSSPLFPYRTSVTILEEQQRDSCLTLDRHRSRSVTHQSILNTSSSASSSPHHQTANFFNLDSIIDETHLGHQRQHSNPSILGSEDPAPFHYDKLRGQPPQRDVETPGSGSDSGYADPIDALRQYYSTQGDRNISEPPYQTLAEIQRARQMQLNITGGGDDEDPTYSRPYDCLKGLPEPVRVSGETSHRYSAPRTHPRQYGRHPQAPSGTKYSSRLVPLQASSDEALSTSSSPSPEPEDELHPLRRSSRSGSLDRLLEPPALPENPQVFVRVKDDLVPMRPRVNSDGNVIKSRNRSCRPDVLSPLALTSSTASEQDHTPSSSPQQSPGHEPVEVTRLQNGFAKLVHPELSLSQS